jgi:hypothetical protein
MKMEQISMSQTWNHEKFQETLAREIAQRKQFALAEDSAVPISMSHHMFDQFLIVGPTSQRTSEILAAFPPVELYDFPVSRAVDYCLPTDCHRRSLRRQYDELFQDQFIFRLAPTVYGFCVHVRQTSRIRFHFLNAHPSQRVVLSFCILTSNPAASVHFPLLIHLARLAVGLDASAGRRWDTPIELRGTPIPKLCFREKVGQHRRIRLEPEFTADLVWFYFDGRSDSVSFGPGCEIATPPRSAQPNSLLLWASLQTLFSLLSLKEILTVVGALMLDGQVLVIGNCLEEITMTVLALQCLLRPFEFSGIVVPLLPNTESHLTVLNTPIPFLIGCVRASAISEYQFIDTCLFVELGEKRTAAPGSALPPFPDLASVAGELRGFLAGNSAGLHPYGPPPGFSRQLGHRVSFGEEVPERIVEIVQSPFALITSDRLACFFVTDLSAADIGVTVFNKELFIATVALENLRFFQMLLDSMTFRTYVEKRITGFARERAQPDHPVKLPPSASVSLPPSGANAKSSRRCRRRRGTTGRADSVLYIR